MAKRIAIFVAVNIVGWFVAWLAGFDFDKRDPLVASRFLAVIWISFCIAILEELSHD